MQDSKFSSCHGGYGSGESPYVELRCAETQKQVDLSSIFWFVVFIGVTMVLIGGNCISNSFKAQNAVVGLVSKTRRATAHVRYSPQVKDPFFLLLTTVTQK